MDALGYLQEYLGVGVDSAVVQAIERATAERRNGPDWSENMAVCDLVNSRKEGGQSAARTLKRLIASDNPKVVSLSLSLCEAAVLNCGPELHSEFGTREFLSGVRAVATGSRGWECQEQAKRLLQNWGRAFKDTRAYSYAECYQQMKMAGVQFPEPENDEVPVFIPVAAPSIPDPSTVVDEKKKLQADLAIVQDKVTLVRQMLPTSPGIDKDEVLAELIGFLEACQSRLVDIIEAGAAGLLGETLFEVALKTNDAVLKTLEAEETGKPIPPESTETEPEPLIDLKEETDP